MRWLALAIGLLGLFTPPAAAVRLLAAGHQGQHTVAALPSGEVVVFDRPGHLLTRRQFGAGIVSLDASPTAAVAVILRRGDGWAALERWDYAANTVLAAPVELAARTWDVALTRGGHAVLAAGPDDLAVLDLPTLQTRRTVPAKGVPAGPVEVVAAPGDLRFAAATGSGFWLGRSTEELLRCEVPLAVEQAPRLRFTPDGQHLVCSGPRGVVLVPVATGLPRRLEVAGVPPTTALDLSSDGQVLFAAVGGRLHVIGLGDGLVRYSGDVLPGQATPRGLVALPGHGQVAILYESGRVIWCRAIPPAVTAGFPTTPVAAGPWPASGDPLDLVRGAVAPGHLFEQQGEALDISLLDRDFERLADLEQAARDHGWAALVLALTAQAVRRPEAVPEPFRPLAARLAAVDLVQLRNVRPRPDLTVEALEALTGAGRPTETQQMLSDGNLYAVFRYGPFLLPRAAAGFPSQASLSLAGSSLRAFASDR